MKDIGAVLKNARENKEFTQKPVSYTHLIWHNHS